MPDVKNTAISAHHGKKKPVRVGINLENACRALQTLRVTELDATLQLLHESMRRLGVEPNKRAHKTYEMDPSDGISINMRSVHKFIRNATKDDAGALCQLEAVAAARFRTSGRKVKKDE